ncbi:hypothetical protein F4556_006591 [Kitasatospora gansuensis]|uniref:Uncharacterized protein n=1 Tax=Kitasatospora gansuensis TaxID=258050 RepID=A0A7W7SKN1_9ACTN|nr:hypothetical protein [Kitasatospora gansuensis]MBB4951056.1 hypothetical protein [Kitasatospora gansuensis]
MSAGAITLSLVDRRLEEDDNDVTRFRRPCPALRGELTTAFVAGLHEIREELQRAVGRESMILTDAQREIRQLRRQLDEARASAGGGLCGPEGGVAARLSGSRLGLEVRWA